jgi:hypothetical protein
MTPQRASHVHRGVSALGCLNFCRSCNTDFASVSAFDRHRAGVHAYTYGEGIGLDVAREDGRRCLTADEMRAAGTADVERARRTFAEWAPSKGV